VHRLSVGEVVEFDGVPARIEVDDGVGANARVEDEIVVAGSADRDRLGIAERLGALQIEGLSEPTP
jgi:hypothetical protein